MTYTVDITDAADAEMQDAFLRLTGWNSEFAGRWLEGLLREIATLSEFPTRCPVAPESHSVGREVRRLLYGRGRNVYRVLFTIVDADGDSELDTVRVLHVRHGARRPRGISDANGC